MSEVLVVVDHVDGAIRKPTYELLTLARKLGEPAAVFFGSAEKGAEAATKLGQYGAEKVYVVDDAEIRGYLVAPKAEALAQLVEKASPAAVLFVSGYEGKEVAGRLAIKVGSGLITDAVDLTEDGTTTQSVFAGNYTVQAKVTKGVPLITVKPNSAQVEEVGAAGTVEAFTATIVFEVCMPARCWIAPEMPFATYSCGETVLPVWPTWKLCGIQPESTAARDAPTAAPSASASPSMGSKLPPVPRPPETTIAASVSSGRPVACRGCWATICAVFAPSEMVAANSSTVPAAPTSSTCAEFGLTVISGTPLVTLACTV